ncbi:malate synthase [Vibrio coralliilyticus]|jgi:malate synthase|uniref:Malate synthase n=1 Tax=Vibrio coralliilyticus TaxID=190893 RepID=A0A097AWK1_9VIBR|nr:MULTISPECIES: malate synthase [Vibrio]AIS56791.1 malate synthase [Vibrio coralliilyticus]AIW21744.1 malate synthase [Vibrio coralliilyticus]ANW26196.1 malate synthase [Vibrio coralliilyticus]EEX33178.1 malate synthase-related protein [Vibrio coralliilyticus ATCC BAA-450]ERB62334.1 malate synthase [Vibrio coralliilyticus OCN008]
MNMLTFDKTEIQKQDKPFIAEAVFAVEKMNSNQTTEKQVKAKQLLDRLFPLESGSHKDVTAYVIDYRHVMAYFKDGSHSGLKHSKHFVAYTGEKEDPESILFRDGTGSHVELTFGNHKGTGCVELVEIDDIQLETCTMFPQESSEISAMRHWISLVKGDEKGKPRACTEAKEYTAKNGDDYDLECCYTLSR